MTASTPTRKPLASRITGMPPPPPAMTLWPFSSSVLMASNWTISRGRGEGTTLRQPRPESSFIFQRFERISSRARNSG